MGTGIRLGKKELCIETDEIIIVYKRNREGVGYSKETTKSNGIHIRPKIHMTGFKDFVEMALDISKEVKANVPFIDPEFKQMYIEINKVFTS